MKNRLIAHRGDMVTYPENSMMAIQSAINLGFSCIEIDIQLSKDAVPIVMHDKNLQRTVGVNKNICELTSEKIGAYFVNNTTGQENNMEMLRVPTLQAIVKMLNDYPEITLFVEIKRQSIEYFGLRVVVEAVSEILDKANFNVVIISFVVEVIALIKTNGRFSSGWVVSKFDKQHEQRVQLMQPDYLFCNINKLSDPYDLWEGPWQWVLYDLRDPAYASELLANKIQFIETGDIVKFANAKEFQ